MWASEEQIGQADISTPGPTEPPLRSLFSTQKGNFFPVLAPLIPTLPSFANSGLQLVWEAAHLCLLINSSFA